jgi:hypothetical protein
MQKDMTLIDLANLLTYIHTYHSPFVARSGQRGVKYVDPHIDMRNGVCFAITFRTYSGEFNFYTTNEERDNPKSLFERCMDWLNSDIIQSSTQGESL